MNVAYNMDCMEAMKRMPDNAFDLAVVDPPYGSGLTENGGNKGWFDNYTCGTKRVARTNFHGKQKYIDDGYSEKSPRLRCHGGDRWDKYGNGVDKNVISWDIAPKQEYFDELFRISRNQIIWGATTSFYPLQDAF